MYTIQNPLKNLLKYPSYSKSKIKEPAINTLTNLEKSLEHFNSLSVDENKKYHWKGLEIIQHLYQNYLFDKYGLKCRLNTKKIKELDIEQNKINKIDKYSPRHSRYFRYGIRLKLFRYENEQEEVQSEIHYNEYLEVISESIVNCLLLNKNKVIPFIVELGGLFHANLLIFRTNTFIAEVFEPHGQNYFSENGLLQKKIKQRYSELILYINDKLSKKNVQKYQLLQSHDTCPQLFGLQSLEEKMILKKKKSEGIGYCQLWSSFIAEMALINPNLTLKQIISSILKYKQEDEISNFLLHVARGMTVYISKKIQKYYKVIFNHNMKIKDIIHNPKKIDRIVEKKTTMKIFKIYLLLDYELFETNKTPQQLLEYYKSQSGTKKPISNKTYKPNLYSYETESDINDTKIQILKNMILQAKKKKLTPVINIDDVKIKIISQKEKVKTISRKNNDKSNSQKEKVKSISRKNNDKPISQKEKDLLWKQIMNDDDDKYLLNINEKRCRKGFERSKKNKQLCVRKTLKHKKTLVKEKENSQNNMPLNILFPRKDPIVKKNETLKDKKTISQKEKENSQNNVPLKVLFSKNKNIDKNKTIKNTSKNRDKELEQNKLKKIKEIIKFKKIKIMVKNILDSKTKEELSAISFNNIYTKLLEKYNEDELLPFYKKLIIFFFNYGKKILEVNNSLENKNVYDKKRVVKTRKIIKLRPGTKRCPKTYRKYKDGLCFKYITKEESNSKINSKIINQTQKKILKLGPGRKRCPRGYIMNFKSGYCENK